MQKITNARYVWDGNYPVLCFTYGKDEVTLISQPKPDVYSAGLVSLDLGDRPYLPDRTVKVAGSEFPITFSGCTDDPRVFALYDAYLTVCADGTFTEGPVPIPE